MMRSSDIQKKRIWGIMTIVLLTAWMLLGGLTVYASEADDDVAICRQELLEMMQNMDSSWHDVPGLKFKPSDINAIWWDLIEEEGYLDYNSYKLIYVTYKMSNGYVTQMALVGLDSEYPLRYASIQNHIKTVQEATQGMSDVEKVLFVGEYVDDITYYTYASDSIRNRACGPLYKGYAVCEGYAEAARLLLRYIDIPVTTVISNDMAHMWNLVQVDGEWYHMDLTWNDAKGQGATDTKHVYFLRNDNEFQNSLPKSHYNWIITNVEAESTSTLYSSWFVHDIIGKMHYYDGLWYYIDNKTGDIVRSEVDVAQSEYEILVDKDASGISKLAITAVENNTLYYTADGVACEITLEEQSSDFEDTGNIMGLDFSDASYWRSGHYSMLAGIYQPYEGRICLQDYVPVQEAKTYQVQISDDKFRVLIRELDSKNNNIASWNLSNNNTFSMNSSTKNLAISIYSRDSNPTYEEYCAMFDNGLTVKLVEAEMVDVNETSDWNNEKYWRSGCYLPNSGCYSVYQTRVCLLDYITVENGANYQAKLSDNKYRMLISEMTADKKFIKSHDLTNGQNITLSSDTAYVAISIYNNTNAWVEYETYLSALNEGMEIGFNQNENIVDESVNVNDTFLWNQIAYWRTGQYSMISGLYKDCYPTRVCLLDYVCVDNTKAYKVILPDSNYHMLIREMSESKNFISSHNLADGDVLIPTEKTEYFAISLYMPENDAAASFDDYQSVIQAGVGLEEIDAVQEISVLDLEDQMLEEVTEEMTEEITEELTTEEAEEEIIQESVTQEAEEETAEVPITEEVEETTEEFVTKESSEETKEESATEEVTEKVIEETTTEDSEEALSVEVQEVEAIVGEIAKKESEEEEPEDEDMTE